MELPDEIKKIKSKKITLSIGMLIFIITIAIMGYIGYDVLKSRLDAIDLKLDKNEYLTDKRKEELRDSIKQANERYLNEKEAELKNKYSSVKVDTVNGGGK